MSYNFVYKLKKKKQQRKTVTCTIFYHYGDSFRLGCVQIDRNVERRRRNGYKVN